MNGTEWHPASNGAGKRQWFVCRQADDRQQEYETADGSRLIRFANMATAQRKADELNASDTTAG